jgi:glycosyltransferase involved in cell wall biosynthesis
MMKIKDCTEISEKKRMLMLTDGNIDQASARVRAIQYIPHFEKSGFKVCLIPRISKKSTDNFHRFIIFPLVKRYLWLKRFYSLYFRTWDFIFIQRSFISEFTLRKFKNKVPVLFDFDDAIYLKSSSAKKRAGIMIKYADEIFVSTEFLNDFCALFNKKGHIVPSPVETDRIMPVLRHPNDLPVIGWIGSSWTTDYLKVVETALQKTSKKIPFRFLSVGIKSDYRIENINHISKEWRYEEENAAINMMDIGIMPLPDDEFARAKGGYKLYLYMSGGIPCVASPVGINSSIIRNNENGFLASSEEEWIDALKKLLPDRELRKRLGENGRRDAISKYDRAVCAEKILGIICRLIKQYGRD